MSKQSEFVREYLRQRGISQRDAAAMIGCAFPTLNNMLTGKRPFNERWATAMQDVWGFRRAFLILGEEPPFGSGNHYGGIVSGTVNGDNHQEVTITRSSAMEAENAQLREQLEQAKEEKARLLGIIETLTKK